MTDGRIKELERLVQKLETEKEALYVDLEYLSLTSEPFFWSRSAVVATRLSVSENERVHLFQTVAELVQETEALKEQIATLKISQTAKVEETVRVEEIYSLSPSIQDGRNVIPIRQPRNSIERLQFSEEVLEYWKGMRMDFEAKVGELEGLLKNEMILRDGSEKKLKMKEEKIMELESALQSQLRNRDTKTQLDRVNSEIDMLREKIRNLEVTIADCNEDLQSAYSELGDKEKQNEEQIKEMDILKTEIEHLKKSDSKRVKELKKRVENLSKELSQSITSKKSTESQLAEIQSQLEKERANYDKVTSRMRMDFELSLKEMGKRVSRAEDLLARQTKEIITVRKEKKEILERVSDKKVLAYLTTGLRGRANSLDGSSSIELESIKQKYQSQVEEMESRIKALDTELATCNNKLRDAEKAKTDAILKASGYKNICLSLTSELQQYGANLPEISFKNSSAFKSMSRMSPVNNNNHIQDSVCRMPVPAAQRPSGGRRGSSVMRRRHSAGNILSWETENVVREFLEKRTPMTPPASFASTITSSDNSFLNAVSTQDTPLTNLLVFHALAKTGLNQVVKSNQNNLQAFV